MQVPLWNSLFELVYTNGSAIDYFQVITDERLPLFICTSCNKKLTNANNFRQKCIESYQFLIGIYENEFKGNSDDKRVPEDVPASTPVKYLFFQNISKIIQFNDHIPTQVVVQIKEELETSNENEASFTSELPTNLAKDENATETTKTKYNGRGRPRKGQEVKKQKRVPKPQPLEMCQICGQLFKCIKTHMFVHDTQPQVTIEHYDCGYIKSIFVLNLSSSAIIVAESSSTSLI